MQTVAFVGKTRVHFLDGLQNVQYRAGYLHFEEGAIEVVLRVAKPVRIDPNTKLKLRTGQVIIDQDSVRILRHLGSGLTLEQAIAETHLTKAQELTQQARELSGVLASTKGS